MKSLFKVIFEDHTYELLGNAAGKERLLKDGMPFLEQVNTASFGSYTFNEPMNGRISLSYRLDRERQKVDIKITQLDSILLQESQSIETVMQDLSPSRPRSSRSAPQSDRLRRSLTSILIGFVVWSLIFSVNFALILVVVLLIHELGHFLAMKAFGYQNLNILFTPPFGAVATGTKDAPVAWQEVIILLAGPIPGIILGYALFYSGVTFFSAALTSQFIIFILFLNYLNLIPVAPLDGGRIFNLVFISQYPRLQWAIAGLGVLYFLYEGIVFGNLISFIFAGLFGLVLYSAIQNKDKTPQSEPLSPRLRFIYGSFYLFSLASVFFFITDIWA